MTKFSYWAHGENVSVDCSNEAPLTPEEAQFIATLAVAQNLDVIASLLKDVIYTLQHNNITGD